MAQTKEGALKARQTIIDKYGEDYFKKIGVEGGKKGTTGGFWHAKYVLGDEDYIKRVSAKGGSNSRKKR